MTITRLGENKFHAYAHSSPPFVADLNCTLDPSNVQVSYDFRSVFPGFSNMTVGPVETMQNNISIVCQAKNVFGVGIANVTVYSNKSETIRPTLQTIISPKHASLRKGENVTFACSYRLSSPASLDNEVTIDWMYNGGNISESGATFTIDDDNLLHLSDVEDDGMEATVSCVASVRGFSSFEQSESEGLIEFSSSPSPCSSGTVQSPAADQQQESQMWIIVGIVLLAAVVMILLIVLIYFMRQRKRHQEDIPLDYKSLKETKSDTETALQWPLYLKMGIDTGATGTAMPAALFTDFFFLLVRWVSS